MKTGMELMSSDSIEASREFRAPMEEQPAVMPSFPQSHLWAIVLAGGDGTRLQRLDTQDRG
jgi:hypothetical protein